MSNQNIDNRQYHEDVSKYMLLNWKKSEKHKTMSQNNLIVIADEGFT